MKLAKLCREDRIRINAQLNRINIRLRRLAGRLLLTVEGRPAAEITLRLLDVLGELEKSISGGGK